MSSLKDIKLAQKKALEQQQLIPLLHNLVQDIERCERTIVQLKGELEAINARFPSPRTTRQDIDYLTALLQCANKKLVWEKQLASLQKRTPAVMEKMSALLQDPKNPPTEQTREKVLASLQAVQGAMERLQGAVNGTILSKPGAPETAER